LINILLNHNANLECFNRHGVNALWMACNAENADALSLLIKRGADVNNRSINQYGLNETVLMRAASTNSEGDKVKILIDNNADINARTNRNKTALHIAANSGNLEVLKLLVDNKADINAQDEWGYTALHLAAKREMGGLELCEFLVENGADICLRGGQEQYTPAAMAREDKTREYLLALEAIKYEFELNYKRAQVDK
jgi:ankyrin repeat protein